MVLASLDTILKNKLLCPSQIWEESLEKQRFQNGRHFTGQLFYYSNNSKSSRRIFTKFGRVIGSGPRTYRSDFEKKSAHTHARARMRTRLRKEHNFKIAYLKKYIMEIWKILYDNSEEPK